MTKKYVEKNFVYLPYMAEFFDFSARKKALEEKRKEHPKSPESTVPNDRPQDETGEIVEFPTTLRLVRTEEHKPFSLRDFEWLALKQDGESRVDILLRDRPEEKEKFTQLCLIVRTLCSTLGVSGNLDENIRVRFDVFDRCDDEYLIRMFWRATEEVCTKHPARYYALLKILEQREFFTIKI
jgi:hypothetical protein